MVSSSISTAREDAAQLGEADVQWSMPAPVLMGPLKFAGFVTEAEGPVFGHHHPRQGESPVDSVADGIALPWVSALPLASSHGRAV